LFRVYNKSNTVREKEETNNYDSCMYTVWCNSQWTGLQELFIVTVTGFIFYVDWFSSVQLPGTKVFRQVQSCTSVCPRTSIT